MDQHDAEAVGILCMDFRFTEDNLDREAVRKAFGLRKIDFLGLAGSAGCAASIDDVVKCAEHARIAIGVAMEKHHTDNVILTNHTECGAYGLAGHSFETIQEEKDFHVRELRLAKAKVLEWYPTANVMLAFVTVDEGDNVVAEVVE